MSQNPFASSSSFTNNPFVEDPNGAHRRFPALSALDSQLATHTPTHTPANSFSGSPSQLYTLPQSMFSPAAYQQPQQQQSYGGFQQQPQLQIQPTGYFGGAVSQPQLSSPIAGQMSHFGYGASPYAQQQGSQQQQYGFSPTGLYGHGQQQQPQPSQQLPGHLQQFDPYSSLGSLDTSSQPQQQQYPQQQQQQQYGGGGTLNAGGASGPLQPPQQEDHPRAWIRSHKNELETWDVVTWKQAILRFDELQKHWERRKFEIQARLDGVQRGLVHPQEVPHWQQAMKDAISNIDAVAALKFQMNEALEYNKSSDLGSKRRVKEAINAGLASLPDFPPPM